MIKNISLLICLGFLSLNVNAIVIKTLNGITYEWLELTETLGMSRLQVEAELTNRNSTLYGYEYASRSLFEDLMLSYASWNGINGFHSNPGVVTGVSNYLDDFGGIFEYYCNGTESPDTTVDGCAFYKDSFKYNRGYYGNANECGTTGNCISHMQVDNSADGSFIMAYQRIEQGWDSTYSSPDTNPENHINILVGSHLVKVSLIPNPAALWLFGSALLGLVWLNVKFK